MAKKGSRTLRLAEKPAPKAAPAKPTKPLPGGKIAAPAKTPAPAPADDGKVTDGGASVSTVGMVDEKVPKPSMEEVGNSGTQTYGGYFLEDHLQELIGIEGAIAYAKMGRSDYQVSMLLDIVKNPILSCDWGIEAVDDSDEQTKIADYVRLALFERMGTEKRHRPFDAYLEEALTFMEHGFSLFEVAHKIDEVPGYGTMVGLKNIGFRDQRSIQRWILDPDDESLKTVEQILNNDLFKDSKTNQGLAEMDGKNLFVITRKMNGSNFAGVSVLRACYGNYVRKNALLKFAIIGAEKTAVGFPFATVKTGSENGTRAAYMGRILQYIRTHERMGAVITDQEKLETLKIEFDAEKLTKMIDSEDTRMTKRFLANFLELGMGDKGGAFSLGQNLSDVFFQTIRIIARQISEPIDKRIIKTLVDVNFGPQEKYPKLSFTGIEDNAPPEFASVLGILKTNNLIQVTDKLVAFVHKYYHLPDFDEEIGMPEDVDPFADPNAVDENGDPIAPEATPVDKDGKPVAKGDPKAVPPAPGAKGAKPAFGKKATTPPAKPAPGGKPAPKPAGNAQLQEESHALLMAEFSKTTRLIKDSKEQLYDFVKADMKRRAALMIAGIEKGMRADESRTAIINNRCQVPGQAKFEEAIFDQMATVSTKTSELVGRELGMNSVAYADDISRFLKNAPAKVKERVNRQVELIAESVDADLRKAVVFSFNNNVDTVDSVDRVIAKITDAATSYINGASLASATGNAVASAVNMTRNDIFLQPEVFDGITSFVVTNPDPEAPICIAMQGRVISKEDYKSADLPPFHHGCETFMVAQTNSQQNKKPIDPRGMTPDASDVPGKSLEQILASKTL